MIHSLKISFSNPIPELSAYLTNLESTYLKTSYELGTLIDKETNPLISRIEAAAIPLMCFLGEIAKIANDINRLSQVLYRSIATLSLRTGNIRVGGTYACEHFRNIAGMVSGIFIGLYSPHIARNLFLTIKAKNLQRKLEPEAASKLYSIAYGVSKFFKKHEIDYRFCHGTLLGAIRHKGLIPWDDDMDLMLHPSSVEKCKKLFENGFFQKETGLEVKKQSFTNGWECFHPESPKGEGELQEIGIPFLDVFPTKLDKETHKITIDSQTIQQLSTEEYMTTKEWDSPLQYEFGPTTLTSIKEAKPYLMRRYGSDAFEFAFQVLHHDSWAIMHYNPFDLIGHIQKVWKYDLPRRTYLEDRSPIKYDVETYRNDVQKIDLALNKS